MKPGLAAGWGEQFFLNPEEGIPFSSPPGPPPPPLFLFFLIFINPEEGTPLPSHPFSKREEGVPVFVFFNPEEGTPLTFKNLKKVSHLHPLFVSLSLFKQEDERVVFCVFFPVFILFVNVCLSQMTAGGHPGFAARVRPGPLECKEFRAETLARTGFLLWWPSAVQLSSREFVLFCSMFRYVFFCFFFVFFLVS